MLFGGKHGGLRIEWETAILFPPLPLTHSSALVSISLEITFASFATYFVFFILSNKKAIIVMIVEVKTRKGFSTH
jgi:hypothetical protein